MEEYYKVVFDRLGNEQIEQLVALLSTTDFNGMEESAEMLAVYYEAEDYDREVLARIAAQLGLAFREERVPVENWNQRWEQHFEPIRIGRFCAVRADFHPPVADVAYEIIITPKMSFGTGHHATTALMIKGMESLALKQQRVLDFGCGTGILSILAEKMGAASVHALDNDDWAIRNAEENLERNACTHVHLQQGSLEAVAGASFDLILANINRHVLLQYMNAIALLLHPAGKLLLSGILAPDDLTVVAEAARNAGLRLTATKTSNGWAAMLFDGRQKPGR